MNSNITQMTKTEAKALLRATEDHLQNFATPASLTGDALAESVLTNAAKDKTTKLVEPFVGLYLALRDLTGDKRSTGPGILLVG